MKQPSLYVGTYHKYASGSIKGAWFNLEDYADKDEFLEACKALHSDEEDAEYMFQGFADFPLALYHESAIDDTLFEFVHLSEEEQEIMEAWLNFGNDFDVGQMRECYAGKFDSLTEWAENFLEDTGQLNEIPERLRYYFDYEAYARDARLNGDIWIDDDTGHTFWRN